jgi:flagellar hook-length control protein FliK
VTWTQSSGEATAEDAERPTGLLQRESSDGERMMGESGAKPLELEPARPAANTAQTQVQTATASTMAATTDETISFNDPLVEDAFELQEKRELNQLRGDERLRERLDLGTDRQGWGLALGSRIVAMVANEVQQARIHLDPPELGSMEIRLQVQQEQTSIQVQVQNPQVREALEANAHRLREALAENGLALAGFDVAEQGSQQSGQHNDGGEGQAQSGWVADGDGDEIGGVSESTTTTVSSDALLDTFA